MRTAQPDRLATVLFGKGKRAILAQLLGSPDRRFFVREIARGASVTASTLSRDLAALTEAGILERAQDGRQVYYQANPRCPVFEELKGLVTKTFGFADVLRETLFPFADRISLAFIYGSVARGEQTARSDIDLMIVGDVGIAGFSERLLEAEKRLAREIVPTVFPKKEFREKVRAENHFLLSVLSSPVILLIGDNDDLQRLAGRKPSKSR
jgi:predicted nucleotidyltransferase/DNA-binding HxlR family transcriptional regulator